MKMTIKMDSVAPVINSRDIVELLLNIAHVAKKQSDIILDFSGVEFISRSAAHELVVFGRDKNIQLINTNDSVEKMFAVVRATNYTAKKEDFQTKRVDIKTLLNV